MHRELVRPIWREESLFFVQKIVMKRGIFVVFEGVDRSGKSTQCAKLKEKLEQLGQNIIQLRFPGLFLSFSLSFIVLMSLKIELENLEK